MSVAERKKQVAVSESKSLVVEFANKFHVEPDKLLTTLKATAFKQKPGEEITNEQMMMLLAIANEYDLNPFLKQIYAFPDRAKGIIPIVGVDGYIRIVNNHPQADGWEYRLSEENIDLDQFAEDIPKWIECIMHRKDRKNSVSARVYAVEAYRKPFEKDGRQIKGPWQTYTRLMLENRAFIRAARFAFGFTGIYSEDDAERMQSKEYIDAESAVVEGDQTQQADNQIDESEEAA